jgi:hypothetical protein
MQGVQRTAIVLLSNVVAQTAMHGITLVAAL